MRFGAERRPDPMLDITPMIDIVFQLVLFFMVTTTFVTAPGIQVDLPRSSAQTLVTEDDDINVWMSCAPESQGGCQSTALHLGDDPVTLEALTQRFRTAAAANPLTLVVMKADKGVPHGKVVRVMDMARVEGLSRLAIATEASGTDDEL